MKKLSIYVVLCSLILSGCGKTVEVATAPEKQPYYITTRTAGDLATTNTIKKSGRLVGAQAITVSSLVSGRVKSIAYKNGDILINNTPVIQLTDTAGTYSLNAQRARTQLDSAQINYTATKRNLEKAISDTTLGIKQAQTQYNAADQSGNGSTALQVQQLDEQIKKAELDYQTQLKNNKQTLDNFLATAKNIAKDVELLYTSVKNESDKILGVTDNYRFQNDVFEQNLGAKNSATKIIATDALKSLISQESLFSNIGMNVQEDNFESGLTAIKLLAKSLQPVLDNLQTVFEFTESSPNTLPDAQLAGFVGTVKSLQGQVQGQISSLTQQINAIQSFLSTYKDQEESLRKQVEISKQQVATTKSNLKDNAINAAIGVESATNNYSNAVDSQQTTIASLGNSIEQARIAYAEAQTQLGKFSVKTPIDGTIGEILVDVGQEVNPGTPLFTINSTNKQQVSLSLSQEDLVFVETGQEVIIYIDGEKYTGNIQSVSSSADKNFTYEAIVSLEGSVELFGDIVDVEIPVRTAYPIIPLDVVRILNRNEGLVNIRNGTDVESVKVTFGKVWGANVEILSELNDDLILIISDIKNFNPNKQIMIEKQ